MRLKFLISIFLIALSLRLSYIFIFEQKLVGGDAREYDAIAWNLASSNGFSLSGDIPTARRMPLYPLFLAGIYKIFGHSYQAVRVLQAVIDSICCIMVFIIASTVFPFGFGGKNNIPTISSYFYAFNPVLIGYTGLILTEILFTFLFLLSMLFLLFYVWNKGRVNIWLCGFFLGLAILCRPTLLLLPIFLLIYFFIVMKEKSKAIKGFLILSFSVIIVLMPWVVRNYQVFDKFIPTTTFHGSAFMYGLLMDGDLSEKWMELSRLWKKYSEAEFDSVVQSKIKEYVMQKPFGAISNVLKSTKHLPRFWITSHSSIFCIDRSISEYISANQWGLLSIKLCLFCLNQIFLILCIIGVFLSRKYVKFVIFFIMLFIYFSLHLNNVPRYHVPIIPYILIFSAVSIDFVSKKLKIRKV